MRWTSLILGAALLAGCAAAPALEVNPAAPGFDAAGSDAAAIAIADRTMERLGGRAAWDATRYLTWDFFGSRRHAWDRHTGDVRVEGTTREDGQPYVVLMNLHTEQGRAWKGGQEVTDPEARQRMLHAAVGAWINDSYWLIMPYKLKDTGVTLRHRGQRDTAAGEPADVLELTFAGVGRTPQNKYHVYVARRSGLVEQWDFFADRNDAEPRFSTPWRGWHRCGAILLSGDRGELNGRPARLGDVAVHAELPAALFTDPAAVIPPPPA
jgi:hypothetical protein